MLILNLINIIRLPNLFFIILFIYLIEITYSTNIFHKLINFLIVIFNIYYLIKTLYF